MQYAVDGDDTATIVALVYILSFIIYTVYTGLKRGRIESRSGLEEWILNHLCLERMRLVPC